MIALQFINEGYTKSKVLSVCKVPKSSFYYKALAVELHSQKGAIKSTITYKHDNTFISNTIVVKWIKKLLSHEFVDYGYLKVTHYLRSEKHLCINPKKVYRMMKENNLLNPVSYKIKGQKTWVKELVPNATEAFVYWEFDIKFVYIHQLGRYAPMLSIIDVYSRYLIGWIMQWSIKKEDVKYFFEAILEDYSMPLNVCVRCDNGSQFESYLVREYLASKNILQEFTRPATPEQNAHIESYHSIITRAVCNRFEFQNIEHATATMIRWEKFYNRHRIHSGINYMSPEKYLQSQNILIPKK